LNGWDAVVSSLGTGLSAFREVSLLTVATGALVTAMTRNGVRLLVCISAFVAQDAKMSEEYLLSQISPADRTADIPVDNAGTTR